MTPKSRSSKCHCSYTWDGAKKCIDKVLSTILQKFFESRDDKNTHISFSNVK
jgi:hypothetical protein